MTKYGWRGKREFQIVYNCYKNNNHRRLLHVKIETNDWRDTFIIRRQ